MSNRTKRLAMLAGAFVLVCAIGWNLISMRTGAASWKSEASAWSSTRESVASPAAALQTGAEDELPGSTYGPTPPSGVGPSAVHGAPNAARPVDGGDACDAATYRSAQCQSYAVDVARLAGLPPDAAPGTRLTLWVAWGPRVSKVPRIQKLIPSLTLERLIPPIVDGAPTTAMLAIPQRHLSDMLYGDRFGSLAVTVSP